MANQTIEQMLKQLETLSDEELRPVRDTADAQLKTRNRNISDQGLLKVAEELGIELHLPKRRMTAEEINRFQPIEIRGEPLSVTVLKERR